MVEKHRIRCPPVIIGEASRLESDGLDEVLLLAQRDQRTTLLDQALDSVPVGSDVTDQFAKLASLEDQLPQSLVTQRGVLLAVAVVHIQADQNEIVDRSTDVGRAEVPRVVPQHPTKVDLS